MIRLSRIATVLCLSSILLPCGAGCTPTSAAAAEGEHEHDPASVTVFGERLLLYLEHPHLVRGVPARFLAHLTVLETGEPVRAGGVTLEIGPARLRADAPAREGLFVPEGAVGEAGTFAARLIVESAQAVETLEIGALVVHADAAGADAAAHAPAAEEPQDTVAFLLEPQWKVRLLLARAQARTLSRRLIVPARAAAPEGRSALVSAPVAGRLSAAEAGALPRTGERVEAGRTLAFVEPPLGAPELAQLRALALELDLQALEVLRATGEAEARLRFAQRELERIGALRAEGLSTQSQLDAAEQGLALARTELEAAARTKASLERLQAEHGAQPTGTLRLRLDAPIAGVISEVSVVDGASVEAGAPAFRILDASRLWIEGRVSEFDLALLSGSTTAVARFAALPGRDVELAGLPWIGPEVEPQSRTLLVRYELDNPDGALRPGMLAELFVATGTLQAAVAVPAEALVLDQGLPTAYVMLEGELFQRRQLELGLRDGDWVEVLAGLAPGERVATRGAWLIQLAALPGAEFGHGHAH
jgi:cobalt-zinc-cadmium efflux system membrane fusion protein